MQELFGEILALQGVKGVMLISPSGEILYEAFQPPIDNLVQSRDWRLFLDVLAGVNETDLVFTEGRIYARRSAKGYILVVSNQFAPSAMIRLHCDILMPELAKSKGKKKKRFFER